MRNDKLDGYMSSFVGVAGISAHTACVVAVGSTEVDESGLSPSSSPRVLDLPGSGIDSDQQHSVVDGGVAVAEDTRDVG